MKKKSCLLIPILVLFIMFGFFAFTTEANQEYTIIDLETLGGDESFAYAINSKSQVVGEQKHQQVCIMSLSGKME